MHEVEPVGPREQHSGRSAGDPSHSAAKDFPPNFYGPGEAKNRPGQPRCRLETSDEYWRRIEAAKSDAPFPVPHD